MRILCSNRVAFALIGIALIVAFSCASTKITSVWKDKSYQKKPGKMLVVAVVNDNSQRRLMEDELAEQLKEAGIEAVPGYKMLPDGRPPDNNAILSKLREIGADTLFMTTVIDRRKVKEHVPAAMPHYPYPDWSSYYGSLSVYPPGYVPGYPGAAAGGYMPAPSPGYTVEEMRDIAESSLFDAATGKLVWSAVTESRVLRNERREIKAYVARIIRSLRRHDLIK